MRRLWSLPARLRQQLADVQGHELVWLRTVIVLFTLNAAITLAYNLNLWAASERVFALAALAFTWTFGIWAVMQAPVFQVGEAVRARDAPEPEPELPVKYERSRLAPDRADAVVRKLDQAFGTDRLHLDPPPNRSSPPPLARQPA